jgi:hypothetical protein
MKAMSQIGPAIHTGCQLAIQTAPNTVVSRSADPPSAKAAANRLTVNNWLYRYEFIYWAAPRSYFPWRIASVYAI